MKAMVGAIATGLAIFILIPAVAPRESLTSAQGQGGAGAQAPAPAKDPAPAAQSSSTPRAEAPAKQEQTQSSSEWRSTKVVGLYVYNDANERLGSISELLMDSSGKVAKAVIGVGGFLGIGEKDVAVRFEDLKLNRDENDSVKVTLNISKETLAQAPDYKLLGEQPVVEGSAKTDREGDSNTY